MKNFLCWLPSNPKKIKQFNNKKLALKWCNAKRVEACINIFVNTDKEDTIYSNGKKIE